MSIDHEKLSGILGSSSYFGVDWGSSHGDFTASVPITRESMFKAIRDAEWLQYEVDPDWQNFCEFGPDDIGGPFEKLGVIRKRRIPTHLMLSAEAMKELNEAMERQAFNPWGNGMSEFVADSMRGLGVIESPVVPNGKAYMFSPLVMPLDYRRVVGFGDT